MSKPYRPRAATMMIPSTVRIYLNLGASSNVLTLRMG